MSGNLLANTENRQMNNFRIQFLTWVKTLSIGASVGTGYLWLVFSRYF